MVMKFSRVLSANKEKLKLSVRFSVVLISYYRISFVVIGTGKYSFMGKTIGLIGTRNDTAHLQRVMGRIGLFCICWIVVFSIAQILVM